MPHHALVASAPSRRSADPSLEWLFRDSLKSVLASARAGHLSDDEASVLLSQLIAVAMERRVTGMVDELFSAYWRRYHSLAHRGHASALVRVTR